jgi:hypothetical protein
MQPTGERARLAAELRRGRSAVPRWTYAPVAHRELRRALDAAERVLVRDVDPIRALYLARLRDLSTEAALCAAAGTSDVARLARERFSPPDRETLHAAAELSTTWLNETATPPSDTPLLSDDPDSRSLLSRMRERVGKLRLPFAVVAQPSLAALAATGDRVILVAAGRLVHEEDALRTVLHEVDGHARPRARSCESDLALVRAGTAGGVDDQEGRALVLEERAGMLGPRRKRQLAARHRAVEAMLHGASFPEVASMLMNGHGLDADDAVIVAERAFRGCDGKRPGLGRERVYLESYVRVGAHLAALPDDETIMAAGQVSIGAAGVLRHWM